MRSEASTDPTLVHRALGFAVLLGAGLLGYSWEVLALLWVTMAVRLSWGMRRVPHLARVGALAEAESPRVFILVAALDEAPRLPRALSTLLAQDYPDYEIIVVNDRSADTDARKALETLGSLPRRDN